MSPDYTRPPWLSDTTAPPVEPSNAGPALLPPTRPSPPRAPTDDGPAVSLDEAVDLADLGGDDFAIVEELRDRVSTRLTAEDKNYAPAARRELTRKVIRDEYDQWVLHQANHGRAAPPVSTEEKIFVAVLAELDGLGRLAPLIARNDLEDIHFEAAEPTMLRLTNGDLVPGPPIAGSEEELDQLLRSVGARSGDGQTSREFSAAHPILNVRLKGVTDLGARLQAAMDVLPRTAGVIRVHRFSAPSLEDLRALPVPMIDTPMHAFLHYAVLSGASILVSGNPGVGKTTLLRALGRAIPYENVVITVEDERELGLHLPRWDAGYGQMVTCHAVCRSWESRLPNAEGRGGIDMGAALHEALRMSPTWCLVGEVRGGYVTALLDAATSGISSVMCTIHSRSAASVFKKVKINALKANPAPDPELVMESLSELDLVVHVHRDRNWDRYVSGIYELGEVGDSGKPSLTPIFASRPEDREGRAFARGAGALSESLRDQLEAVGFNAEHWLDPVRSDWPRRPVEAVS